MPRSFLVTKRRPKKPIHVVFADDGFEVAEHYCKPFGDEKSCVIQRDVIGPYYDDVIQGDPNKVSERKTNLYPSTSPSSQSVYDYSPLLTPEETPEPRTGRELQCMHCDKSFPTPSLLLHHTRLVHKDKESEQNTEESQGGVGNKGAQAKQEDPNYTCNKCHISFQAQDLLEAHIKNTHGGSKPYKCPHCSKSFTRSWNFQRHVLIHSGQKPHKCDKCPKAFVLAAHLKIHTRIHTGERPYKCNICFRGFAQLTNLQRHVLTHTGQKPHKCTYCPKAFVSSSDLRRHTRIHTGEKPYRCKQCDKAFTTSGNLQSHFLTHSGQKPFQCQICKWKFISSSNLRTHVRIHHFAEWKEGEHDKDSPVDEEEKQTTEEQKSEQ